MNLYVFLFSLKRILFGILICGNPSINIKFLVPGEEEFCSFLFLLDLFCVFHLRKWYAEWRIFASEREKY